MLKATELADSCRCSILMAMSRVLHILLLVLVLGPQFGAVTLSVTHECEETRDCCGGGACDDLCPQCPCCVERAPAAAVALIALPLVAPPTEAPRQPVQLPQPPRPADILHVPKTTLA